MQTSNAFFLEFSHMIKSIQSVKLFRRADSKLPQLYSNKNPRKKRRSLYASSQKFNADLYRVFTVHFHILQIDAVITEGYVEFYVQRLFCTDFAKIYTK